MDTEEEGKEDNEEEDKGRRWIRRRRGRRIMRRRTRAGGGGGYALGFEANFLWSRALAHAGGGTERITGSSEIKRVF